MEKNNRDTVIQPQGGIIKNNDETATNAPLNEQLGTEDENEPGTMERIKEVAENIGITINGI